MQKTRIQSLDWEDPLEKETATKSVFLPGESHGLRSLAGYSPWDSKRVKHDLATKHTEEYRDSHTQTHKYVICIYIYVHCSIIQMSINVHFPEETQAPESQVLLASCG